MRSKLSTVARFIYGLSVLGLLAIVNRVARGTFENVLMQDVGPAVMVVIRKWLYGVRNFFAGIFAGGGKADAGYAQAAA